MGSPGFSKTGVTGARQDERRPPDVPEPPQSSATSTTNPRQSKKTWHCLGYTQGISIARAPHGAGIRQTPRYRHAALSRILLNGISSPKIYALQRSPVKRILSPATEPEPSKRRALFKRGLVLPHSMRQLKNTDRRRPNRCRLGVTADVPTA